MMGFSKCEFKLVVAIALGAAMNAMIQKGNFALRYPGSPQNLLCRSTLHLAF